MLFFLYLDVTVVFFLFFFPTECELTIILQVGGCWTNQIPVSMCRTQNANVRFIK